MTQFVSLALALALIGCQRNGTSTEEKRAEPKPVADQGTEEQPAPAAAPAPPSGEPAARVAPAQVAPSGVWQASPLGRDVERVCNVLTYAGVTDKTPNEQLNAILEWLPQNIESEDGRNFLGSIAELQGDAKADALEAAAQKVGLKDCQLAASWRQPPQ